MYLYFSGIYFVNSKKIVNFGGVFIPTIIMEEFKKRSAAETDKEIVFSKAIKAGKRIYYLDVKKSRKNEMFLAITESKKIISGEGDDSQVNFEKHKIFLYKEDFEKFTNGLNEAINYIIQEQGACEPKHGSEAENGGNAGDIKIDIDF